MLQRVEAKTDELIELKTKIEEVRSSLAEINQNLQKLKTKGSTNFSLSPKFSTFEKTQSFDPQNPKDSILKSLHNRYLNRKGKVVSFDPSGFYILPFLGLLSSESLFLSEFKIEEGIGKSIGLSIGYEGRGFFSDIQLSYIQNRMKKINLPFSESFSGTTKGLGIHLTGGGRIHFNEYISCSLGVGIGGVNQDMSFLLSDLLVQEKDFLMSYQIFSGIEYRPVDSSSLGVRYRWLHIDEMDIFSSRDLHLIELWLGYLF